VSRTWSVIARVFVGIAALLMQGLAFVRLATGRLEFRKDETEALRRLRRLEK
jgi:hypothetical protein